MDKLDVKYVIGYQGSPLHYVDSNLALGLCGNTLYCHSLAGGPGIPLLRGEGFGISAIAYTYSNDWVAYAEKGLRPSVYVHDYRSQKLIAKLTDVAELEVCYLAFSRRSSRLLVCSSEPDFRVVLWSLESEQPVKLSEGQMKWAAEYASFSPANADHICVNGSGKIAVWTFEQSFKRITFTCKHVHMSPFRPQCHAWAPSGDYLYVGSSKGEVLVVDSSCVVGVNPEDEQSSEVSLQELIEEGIERTLSEGGCEKHTWEAHTEWKFLCLLSTREKVSCICCGDFHILVIGNEGSTSWFYVRGAAPKIKPVPTEAEQAKPKVKSPRSGEKALSPRAQPSPRVIVEEKKEKQEKHGPDTFPLSELDLGIYDVVTASCRSDGLQMVVGSAGGSVVVAKINAQLLQSLAHGYSPRSSHALQAIGQVENRGVYHEGPIHGVCTTNGGKLIVTVGEDGTLRVWDAERFKEVSRQCFQSALTCIDSNEENSVVVIGSATGYLSVVKVDTGGRTAILFRAKLHKASVDKIGFNKTATHVVAVSKVEGKVFFLKRSAADIADLTLLGFAILQDVVLAFAWDIPVPGEEIFLLLSLGRGEIAKIKVPSARAPGGGFFFESKALRRISFRVASPALAMSVGKYYLEKEGVERKVLWAMGQDKKLQQYRLPDSLQAWSGPDAMPHTPHFIIPGHAKPGTALYLNAERSLLITGAEDGSLQLRTSVLDPLSAPQKVREMQMYDGYAGGLTCVTMAGGRIYTGGANGFLFICDVGGAGRQPANISPRESTLVSEVEADDVDEPTLVEKHEQTGEGRSTMASQSFATNARNMVADLRQEFEEIAGNNEKVPEMEKLTRAELIVDLELEKSLRQEGEKRVVSAREEVKVDNLRKDLLASRIKEECWSIMDEPQSHIWPFIQGFQIPNFPMHVKHKIPSKLGRVAKLLRIVEMQEMDYIQKTKFTMATPLEDEYPTERSGRQEATPSPPPLSETPPIGEDLGDLSTATGEEETRATSSGGKSDQTTTAAPPAQAVAPPPEEEDEEIVTPEMLEKGPVEGLLYDSFSLTTSKRKRSQRLLLQAHILEIKRAFNDKMEDARKNKMQSTEKVREMYNRIRELQKALGHKDEFPLPELNRSDNFKAIFEVKPDEISVPKPITEEERLDAIKRGEEEAARLKLGGDAPERALMDMMGGQLQMKEEEDATSEGALERPPWMNNNPKTFTKEQIKEFKEYEQKLKTMKEEREKKVRAQEAEMRKLKVDIMEVMTSFDTTLLELYTSRIDEESKCIVVEQTITLLSTEIEDEELRDEKKEKELAKALDALKASKGRSVGAATEFKREVDDFKDRFEFTIQEDKALDRNFKKDFQDCGEVAGLLYKHFKKRRASPKPSPKMSMQKDARRGSLEMRRPSVERRGSFGKGPQLQRRRSSSSSKRSSVLARSSIVDPFDERPEDIEADHWDRLLGARNRKILKEEEVRKTGETLQSMVVYLQRLTSQDDQIRKRIEKALRNFAEFRENREKKKRNMAFCLHMKQGLVEVELSPLDEGYTDAVLLPRNIVEEFNVVILREAHSKIDMLIAIKDFRRGIYDVQWEIRRHQVLQGLLAEKIRYIQLLRNTKALQKVIKNKDDVASASESVGLENRLEHNQKLHEKKMAEKEVHLLQLTERTTEIKVQNSELQKQAATLHQNFTFCHMLCSKSMGGSTKDAALKEKISSIAKKTWLRDLSKEQLERMMELSNELQIITLRAHPQFAAS